MRVCGKTETADEVAESRGNRLQSARWIPSLFLLFCFHLPFHPHGESRYFPAVQAGVRSSLRNELSAAWTAQAC